MISKPTIKKLIDIRLRDAAALFEKRRYAAAIYLGGYALELSLKYRICRIMLFGNGFPENKVEFSTYYKVTRRKMLRATLKELRDIKHHNLEQLLKYSGEQINITSKFLSDWNKVKTWNSEMRYDPAVIRKKKAGDFLKSLTVIVNQLK